MKMKKMRLQIHFLYETDIWLTPPKKYGKFHICFQNYNYKLSFQSLHTKIVHLPEKSWVIRIYNFVWKRPDSTKRQFYHGSKTSALSVRTESCPGLIFMVKCNTSSKLKLSKLIISNSQNSSVKYFRRATQKASVITFSEYLILMEITSWISRNTWWRWTLLSALTRDKSLSGHSG